MIVRRFSSAPELEVKCAALTGGQVHSNLCRHSSMRAVVHTQCGIAWLGSGRDGGSVYAGLLIFFLTCFNDTLSRSGCVVGDPFEDKGRVCVCVCVCG